MQSYTPGTNVYGVDLYSVNFGARFAFRAIYGLHEFAYFVGRACRNFTGGLKIAYISSLPFPNIIPLYGILSWGQFREYLHNEVFLMNSNGTGVQQLMYFNTPGSPEYTPQFDDATYPLWNLDGTQLLVQNGTADDPVPGGNSTWMVNFQGACGGQASQ